MKKSLCLILTLVVQNMAANAAEQSSELEQLKAQLRETNAAFEQAMQQHRTAIEAISERIQSLEGIETPTDETVAVDHMPDRPAVEVGHTHEPPTPSWSPSQPITLAGGGSSYLNLSFDALFTAGGSSSKDIGSLEFGGHDPKQNGFTVQNLELTLDGAVDPYFRGQANLITQLDVDGETTYEVEEAFLESISLPWGLQVKAGQYFTTFGRINPMHPHTWDFVDQPLVIGRMMGPDAMRNPGAQVSWLAPTPFYSELLVSVQDSQGGTAFSFRNEESAQLIAGRPGEPTSVNGAADMLYVPRYAMSFDLADAHTVVLGASAALAPNATGGNTRIYGADLFYKWSPPNRHMGFPFVTWQTEYLYRDYAANAYAGDPTHPATPDRTISNWGVYSQVSYGFRPRWIASLRGDYATGERGDFSINPLANDRARVSPAVTFYPSEFSKLRLQFNYDDIQYVGDEYSIWFQFEFMLGAHSSHKY